MKINSNFYIYDLKVHGDIRGSLVSIEENKNIPFPIKRVYYIFDTKSSIPRGFHAHKELEQVLICVNGACKIKIDDGKNQSVFELNSPSKALYIGKNLWREMTDFSQGCVLMVLASTYYDPNEYIRDYNEFLKNLNN